MSLDAASPMTEPTSTQPESQVEEQTFVPAAGLVMHVINSQSGSLAKALLESVMNSVDAGATRIDITLESERFTVVDDGHGMRTRDEILSVFKVFGFDHSEHDRKYGKFGLGRGQAWKFARTRWYTTSFMLDVDIRTRGLQWLLHKDQPHVDGVRIEGDFYERLTQSDILETGRELEKLVRYCDVPVVLNGRDLTVRPSSEKWNEETDEAFIRVSESAYLRVYNMGVFVQDIYAGYQGVGGVLVTKPGHKLVLNMARNEVDRALCPLWKQLQKTLRSIADKRIGKESKKRFIDADRDYVAGLTAHPSTFFMAAEKASITLCTNKHISLDKLIGDLTRWRNTPIYLTSAESGSRIGETLLRDRAAIVLAQATLDRYGAATVTEFVNLISARRKSAIETLQGAERNRYIWRDLAKREHFVVADDIKDVPAFRQLNHSKIPDHELTQVQGRFLMAVRDMMPIVAEALEAHGGSRAIEREVFIGRSETAEAYTDGSSYVGIVDRAAAKAIKDGLPGFLRIAHILVHELLHDDDDSGSHVHDMQFYEDFHEVVLDQGHLLYKAAAEGFKRFAKLNGVSTKVAAQLDRMQQSEAVVAKAL